MYAPRMWMNVKIPPTQSWKRVRLARPSTSPTASADAIRSTFPITTTLKTTMSAMPFLTRSWCGATLPSRMTPAPKLFVVVALTA